MEFNIQWNYRRLSVCRSEANRIKYEFVTANRTRTFLLFLCFFFKKFGSVRSKRTSKLTEYDAFKSWRYWIMLNRSIRFDYIEPNFIQKNTKIIKKFVKVRVQNRDNTWQNRISSTEFGSVRFENLLKFDSFTVC